MLRAAGKDRYERRLLRGGTIERCAVAGKRNRLPFAACTTRQRRSRSARDALTKDVPPVVVACRAAGICHVDNTLQVGRNGRVLYHERTRRQQSRGTTVCGNGVEVRPVVLLAIE